MKYHKSFIADRKEYTYEFADDKGSVFTVKPGKDGVTEVLINELHKDDDREVEGNLKSLYPGYTSRSEKKLRREWRENYIRKFQEDYGYIPCRTDVDYAVACYFRNRRTLSIEGFRKRLDEEEPRFLGYSNESEEYREAVRERIIALLKDFSLRDRQILTEVYINGIESKVVAVKYGISEGRVSQILSKMSSVIKKDKFLKKFFIFN